MWKRVIIMVSICCLMACNRSNKNVLVMGTDATFPPFAYMEAGEIRGFDIELGQLLAQKLQKSLKVKTMPLPSLIAAVTRNKVDFAIAALGVTPERQQQFNFTDTYFSATQFLLMHKNSQFSINSATDLRNRRVGIQMGSTANTFVQNVPGIIATPFETPITAIRKLHNRKLDVVIVDRDVAKKLIRDYPDIVTMPATFMPKETYAIALPKSKPQLLLALNAALKELQQDGSLEKLFSKYFQITVK